MVAYNSCTFQATGQIIKRKSDDPGFDPSLGNIRKCQVQKNVRTETGRGVVAQKEEHPLKITGYARVHIPSAA